MNEKQLFRKHWYKTIFPGILLLIWGGLLAACGDATAGPGFGAIAATPTIELTLIQLPELALFQPPLPSLPLLQSRKLPPPLIQPPPPRLLPLMCRKIWSKPELLLIIT